MTTAATAHRTRDRRLAVVLFVLVVVELALAATFQVLDSIRSTGDWGSGVFSDIGFIVAFGLFPVVGLLIAMRRPGNRLAWVLLVTGVVGFMPFEEYGAHALAVGLPLGNWSLGFASWTWVPMIGLAGVFVPLLFPDGHLPSGGWRWVARAAAAGMILTSLTILLSPGTLGESGYPHVRNPFGVEALASVVDLGYVFLVTIPLGVIAAAVSLGVRYRRSGPTERLQIRWFRLAAIVVAVAYVIALAVGLVDAPWVGSVQAVAISLFALLPIAIGVAVLRYRLYDIDLVVRKTVVVAAIAAFFTLVYVGVVGGIGAIVQTHATTVLSFVAAALVALLFQPVLAWARRFADRVVYGKRATPYEVLAHLGQNLAGTYAADDVVPRIAQVLGEGVGARRVGVLVTVSTGMRELASWPADAEHDTPDDRVVEVRDRGEVLGALAVSMPANDPIDPAREKLIEDLAAQAGLALRNVRLTTQLQAKVAELTAAQKRIVAAQDSERRRLERNIHDGAQQQLVALAVKARLARSLVGREDDKASVLLEQIGAETQDALEELRDLARGIYPPLLADKGLSAALEAQARKSPVPVRVQPDGIGRYEQGLEAAVYFSILEALQNTAKYARASRAAVELDERDGLLSFEVSDDGGGFDPTATRYGTGLQGIADRLSALGGSLDVRSAPGAGTTIAGSVPVGSREGGTT
jgi:signal transduction histidine kinase